MPNKIKIDFHIGYCSNCSPSSKRKVLCYRPAISGFVDENERHVEIGHIDLCLACIAREFESNV
ncbi:MAG: hypothetical protein MRERV_11c062 [Mycoplasmataceae bacterium RV_VA103A]|nr:MAG: hypothetical protein MRERV_11c062 [Mycoplasmataceae bacterium RV_VA103A]